MRLHALSTGTVAVKDAFLHARTGPTRQLRLFTPGPFSDPLPIHVWVVEHDERRILVDTGETAAVGNVPFARFDVRAGQELPAALEGVGVAVGDLDEVILTHMHGDHMDGAVHLRQPVLVHDAELAFAHSWPSRVFQRVLGQPIPDGVRFTPVALDGGPFGAFAASRPLTADGRVVAVATPGHTPGHISVVCVDDDGRHVLLAGDATDTLEQLRARRPDAVGPKPKVHVQTLDRILAHGRQHPTVYLPSHDPESAARLARRELLERPPWGRSAVRRRPGEPVTEPAQPRLCAARLSWTRVDAPDVNPRAPRRRSSAELAVAVRKGRRFAEALRALSDRAENPDGADLRLAEELARTLVRRCDTRHEGWQTLRDTLQAAGADIPWARAERQAHAPVARIILADCATPGRTPLLRVQHAAAEQRARALAPHVDPTVAAQLGAPEIELDSADWPDALAAAVRARSRSGLAAGLRASAGNRR